MAKLEFSDYLRHIRDESHRFRDVLSDCDPRSRVPSCPDWNASDLLWHLADVQWFWARDVRTRPDSPGEDLQHPERPTSYDGLLAAFDESSAALVAELEAADPAETAWTWASEQSVGFIFRRQAHEALIHRLDAELTAGSVTPLWFDMGAAHVVVLADSDEERALAAGMNDERATVASGDPAALLASLRTIAKSTAPGRRGRPQSERRSGPTERRRHPRYDRRS